jgi:hypothetical protein
MSGISENNKQEKALVSFATGLAGTSRERKIYMKYFG